jgi:hypothetical protein
MPESKKEKILSISDVFFMGKAWFFILREEQRLRLVDKMLLDVIQTKLQDPRGSKVIRGFLIKSQAAMQNIIAVTSYLPYSTVCYAANKNVCISVKKYY